MSPEIAFTVFMGIILTLMIMVPFLYSAIVNR